MSHLAEMSDATFDPVQLEGLRHCSTQEQFPVFTPGRSTRRAGPIFSHAFNQATAFATRGFCSGSCLISPPAAEETVRLDEPSPVWHEIESSSVDATTEAFDARGRRHNFFPGPGQARPRGRIGAPPTLEQTSEPNGADQHEDRPIASGFALLASRVRASTLRARRLYYLLTVKAQRH